MKNKPDVDISIWKQERGFWIPRATIILATNSILFLGYIQIRDIPLGIIVSLLALISNILFMVHFSKFSKRLDKLQERIKNNLPPEYREKTLTGRWGFIPLLITFEILWVSSFLYSYFGIFS